MKPKPSRRSPSGRVTPTPKLTRKRRVGEKKNAATESVGDHLSTYFRELGAHDLLTADQEQELARNLEAAELSTWEALLSYPPTVDYLLSVLEVRLENSLKDFKSLRALARTAKSSRRKDDRDQLGESAKAVAKQLRVLDLDRHHAAALVAEVERLTTFNGEPPRSGGKITNTTTAAFEKYLQQIVSAHNRAGEVRDRFVRANLRLVVTMARRFDRGGLPLSDLIQEGNLGLMHAVSRFDYNRGLRFSTYACWWIRHAIGRALADKSRAVRVPVHMIEAQQQLRKIKSALTSSLGREPTGAEIAEAANMTLTKFNQMSRYLLGQSVSLDGPVHASDEVRTLGDILADPVSEEHNSEDRLTTQTLAHRVDRLMVQLSPIEADVLRQRFGLIDDDERTFREIGDQYQLSRERIRQIQNAALGKLRRALERTGDL